MVVTVNYKGRQVPVECPDLIATAAGEVVLSESGTSARVRLNVPTGLRERGVSRLSDPTASRPHPRTGSADAGVEAESDRGVAFLLFETNPGLRELVGRRLEINRKIFSAIHACRVADPEDQAIADAIAESNRAYAQEDSAREARRARAHATADAVEPTEHEIRWHRATEDPNGSY